MFVKGSSNIFLSYRWGAHYALVWAAGSRVCCNSMKHPCTKFDPVAMFAHLVFECPSFRCCLDMVSKILLEIHKKCNMMLKSIAYSANQDFKSGRELDLDSIGRKDTCTVWFEHSHRVLICKLLFSKMAMSSSVLFKRLLHNSLKYAERKHNHFLYASSQCDIISYLFSLILR